MALGKRLYWVVALVAVLALAGAGITLTSHLTSAGGSTPSPSADACAQQDEADDGGADDANENEAADANENEADDAGADSANEDGEECDEAVQPAGTLDDGKELLPQAKITIDQAIAAAQTTGTGAVGEVDLEDYNGRLAFNVDIGDKDVKVDAADGTILSADATD